MLVESLSDCGKGHRVGVSLVELMTFLKVHRLKKVIYLNRQLGKRQQSTLEVTLWRVLHNGVYMVLLTLNKINMKSVLTFVLSFLFCVNVYSQKVFVSKNASNVNYRVFVVNNIRQADIVVRVVRFRSQAKNNNWFFVKFASEADLRICYVNRISQSNLKVYFR
jgi:hypothetical protein